MKLGYHLIYVFVIVVLAILLGYVGCNNPKSGAVVIQTVTKTDTIYGEGSIKEVSVPYAIRDTFRVTDTLEIASAPITIKEVEYILKEAKVPTAYYSDTMRFDSSGFAVLKDTIQGLRSGLGWTYNIFKTTTSTTTQLQPKKKVKILFGCRISVPIKLYGRRFIASVQKRQPSEIWLWLHRRRQTIQPILLSKN